MRGVLALLLVTALLAGGCTRQPAPPPPPPPLLGPQRLIEADAVVEWSRRTYPETRACGIVTSGPWRGLIRDRADGARDLVLIGQVGVKPSARVTVVLDPLVRESYPVQRRAELRAQHPLEPTIDMLEQRAVEETLVYNGELGVLSLMCGTAVLATFSDPREAR